VTRICENSLVKQKVPSLVPWFLGEAESAVPAASRLGLVQASFEGLDVFWFFV
jgi:hypothetical protein